MIGGGVIGAWPAAISKKAFCAARRAACAGLVAAGGGAGGRFGRIGVKAALPDHG